MDVVPTNPIVISFIAAMRKILPQDSTQPMPPYQSYTHPFVPLSNLTWNDPRAFGMDWIITPLASLIPYFKRSEVPK